MKKTVSKTALMACLLMALCLLCLPAFAEVGTAAFSSRAVDVYVGEQLQLQLSRTGDAALAQVTYTSSAENRAAVNDSGLVTGVSRGQAVITAVMQVGDRTLKATVQVTIKQRVTDISLAPQGLHLYPAGDASISGLLATPTSDPTLVVPAGSKTLLRFHVQPGDADERRVVLTSSDESVVRVQGQQIIALRAGEADLTVQAADQGGASTMIHVLAVQPVKRMTLTAPVSRLRVGETTQVTPGYEPEDATVKQAEFQSANPQVATVDAVGTVTAVGRGRVNIIARATDGSGRSAVLPIQVVQQPQSITLIPDSAVLHVGAAQSIRAQVMPANADNKQVTWSSSDTSIATVNQYGRITPVAPGTVTITATAVDDPSVTGSASVEVRQLVQQITFPEKSFSFNIRTTAQLTWTVLPDNATDKSVTITSTNPAVATVDASGTLTGLKRGSTNIIFTANDGSRRRGVLRVNVLQPVEGVHMKNDTVRVGMEEWTRATAVLEPADASNRNMTWVSADSSIARVKGNSTRPSVYGVRWGTTTITGTTEDGGFTATATVKVGNYDKALAITDLYVVNDKIKISVKNKSNMTISHFYFTMEVYNIWDQPLPVNKNGTNVFNGSYNLQLSEGETTTHGKFYFQDFVQPMYVGRVVMTLTGYRTVDGYSRNIAPEKRPTKTFTTANWVPLPTPVPAP